MKTPEQLAEDNMDADRNNLAGFLYEVYCDAVGGKAWWHEFKSNMNKQYVIGVRRRYNDDQEWKHTWEFEDGFIYREDDVTHWMPLPKPPTEE
jgi:hypothetical protein